MINSVQGFHIEPTNICTLQCPGCSRTQFIKQWPQHWSNHSLDIDSLFNFLDIDLHNKKIILSGNYGDPIYHPDILTLVKELKNRKAVVSIVTNGSYKKTSWWEELVSMLSTDDKITFSIDGIPENFTEYRKNGDWESIQVGMSIVAQANCMSIWKYIPFSYNQNQIHQAETLSQQIGIKQFCVSNSDRFDQHTQHLIPDFSFLGQRYSSQTKFKRQLPIDSIYPKCQNNQEHFITADGHYSPCCYIADHRFYYKTPFGKNKKSYNIRQTTFSKILKQAEIINFYQTLDQQPVCQYNCPNTCG